MPPPGSRTWAWNLIFTTSVGCATATAIAPVEQPASSRAPIPASSTQAKTLVLPLMPQTSSQRCKDGSYVADSVWRADVGPVPGLVVNHNWRDRLAVPPRHIIRIILLTLYGLSQSGKDHFLNSLSVWHIWTPTVWPACVELLHGVIQADADWGEAHLSVQPRHQPAVKTPGTLGLHHGEDGPENASVFYPLGFQWGFGFTLNLKSDRSREQNVQNIPSQATGDLWNVRLRLLLPVCF